MITLPFSYNWNNKLDCHAFTTIRIYNPNIHFIGNAVDPVLKGVSKGKGVIADVKIFRLKHLNPFISYLDTGYSVEECAAIITKMYPKIDFNTKQLAFILIVKDK